MENRSENTKENSPIAKYTIKDSVFTSLFQDKKYLLQLYRTLHPEDKETTEDCAIEVKVKMIYGDDAWKEPASGEQTKKDIISQYITFTKVYNEQLKLYKRTRKTITETIRICKDRNVLTQFLQSREKEGGCGYYDGFI